jgi:hypothetical protein
MSAVSHHRFGWSWPVAVCVNAAVLLALILIGCNSPGATTTTSSTAEAVTTGDTAADWPVVLQVAQGTLEMYQPQPEEMTGNSLKARAAVSLTRESGAQPVFGAIWFTARVDADRDTRTVILDQLKVTRVAFHDSTAAEEQDFGKSITSELASTSLSFPLDQLMASLDTARQEKAEDQHLSNTPPQILFSTVPATLISVNGPPRLQAVDSHPGVSRVANTPFILLCDDSSRHYFLKAGSRWVGAPDISGPWADTADVPPAITAAGSELTQPTTQPAGTPAAPSDTQVAPAAANAKVIVVTKPTELIVTAGTPAFTQLPGSAGGDLLYASNTKSDLFLDQADHSYYVLLSGRWFTAKALGGPWQYIASDSLPGAFALIPPDSTKSEVLPFVAKTAEAHEAILDSRIPQTADIRRDAGAKLSVAYDGEPQFKDVPESPGVAYAVNTPEAVLRVNGVYYCCHQAVWYQSNSPTGPWTVCTSVPQVIYTLPPSCPDYNVRYVYVYDSYPDYVTDGYLPGYTGTYVDNGSIVYGTGYDYPGWYGTTYFPPPCTWGYDAYYDPFACDWGFDAGLYWGGDWFARPWHEGWWRDHPNEHFGWHGWWGHGGFQHAHDIRGNLVEARGHGIYRTDGTPNVAARLPGDFHGSGLA